MYAGSLARATPAGRAAVTVRLVPVLPSLVERVRGLDPRLVDGAVVVALLAAALTQLLSRGAGEVVHVPAVMGTIAPLYWRRQRPLACYAVQFLSALFTLEVPTLASLIALFAGVYSASAYSSRRLLSLSAPLVSAAVLAALFPSSYPSLPAWGLELVGGLGMWLAGSAMRERQGRNAILEQRASQLEHERELGAMVAVADERARIARELHDVIAHSVSVMVVQAGAARRLLARAGPSGSSVPNGAGGAGGVERAGEALLEVEASGREALTELRRLLGVLAERPDELVLAPQPGLGQLDALVDRVGTAGVAVELRIVGAARPLPPGLDLTAYRILQEALTNVLRHAAGARTEVVVEYGERELRLAVVDGGGSPAGGPPGAGRGLLGMQERVAVYGGHVHAASLPEGGFEVRARLPLEPV